MPLRLWRRLRLYRARFGAVWSCWEPLRGVRTARAPRNPQTTSRQPLPPKPKPQVAAWYFGRCCAFNFMLQRLVPTPGIVAQCSMHAVRAHVTATLNASPPHPGCSSLTLQPPLDTDATECATSHCVWSAYCAPFHLLHARTWLHKRGVRASQERHFGCFCGASDALATPVALQRSVRSCLEVCGALRSGAHRARVRARNP